MASRQLAQANGGILITATRPIGYLKTFQVARFWERGRLTRSCP